MISTSIAMTVTIYNRFRQIKHLLIVLLLIYAGNLQAQNTGVPGIVISHQPAYTNQYIGSPSIAILSNGDYVASHDLFGPESFWLIRAISHIYRSSDKGLTWSRIAEIKGAFWSKLFVHREALYFIGPDRNHGILLIRKSTDGGVTWTEPVSKENGLLSVGEYHCAPTPVIEHNGRLWRAMETAHGPVRQWGKRYGAMMWSIPVDADLLKADNWTRSNFLLYDSTYLSGNFNAWLEGNAVVAPSGEIVNVLRVDQRNSKQEMAAIVHVSADGKKAVFTPERDFVLFPGGSKKFSIRSDAESGQYWALSNAIPEEFRMQFPEKNAAGFRNTLALISSPDLVNWHIHDIVLQHPDVQNHGFQYVDWQFEGDDIVFVSRTACTDRFGGARNNHDANFLTFHRINNFRKGNSVSGN